VWINPGTSYLVSIKKASLFDTNERSQNVGFNEGVPKIAIFEEAARTLDIPGGTKMIQEYYRQMRKFGCNILAVDSSDI
jgi:hypothetical protein